MNFPWLKINAVKEPDSTTESKEINPLDFFEIRGETCPFCLQGPVIKCEPQQFKVQCWKCYRIFDKSDLMVVRERTTALAPDSWWIQKKIKERTEKINAKTKAPINTNA